MNTTKAPQKSSDTAAETQNPQRFSGEWETKQLQDISDINPQNFSSNTNPDDKFNYISLEQVDSGRLLGYSEEVFQTAPSRAQRVLQNGDVLMSTVRPNLMAHLFFQDQIPNAVCSTGFAVLRAKRELAAPYFLFAQLFSKGVNDQIAKILAGSNYPAINSRDVKLIEISCPPQISEQRAIAEVLSDVDGLLNALDALIAKKRAIKQATMQQLLTGKTRLPGFSGKWETVQMGQIGLIYGGLSGKTKIDFEDGNERYVTFLGVLENVVLNICHTERVHVGPSESQNSVMKGDLLFNASSETPGDLAIGAVMGEQLDNLYLNSFCFGFRVHDQNKYVPLFLAYFFRGNVGRDIMNALAQGATRYNMSKSQFRASEISIPSGAEQYAITSVLSDMDAEIAALEQRREKNIAIKHGMMQQLLTGRVRLPESRIDSGNTDRRR